MRGCTKGCTWGCTALKDVIDGGLNVGFEWVP